MPEIISRSEARNAGATRYFTGRPCGRGHIDERLVLKGMCCECHRIATRKSYQKNPDRQATAMKRWRVGNPEKARERGRKARLARYGLDEAKYQAMIIDQNNACAICALVFLESPNIDHCHTAGHVRGLLCGECNRGLGLFKDRPELLQKAIEYLSCR